MILGRLMSGWLMDRIWAPVVAFVLLCLPATACLLLASGSLTYWHGRVHGHRPDRR